MRMRRVLALLFALFCIWSSLFSAAFAVEIPPDLDDLDIDPWGDLGLIQETPEPAPTAPIGEPALQDPVELEPAGEGESFFSLYPDGSSYAVSFPVSGMGYEIFSSSGSLTSSGVLASKSGLSSGSSYLSTFTLNSSSYARLFANSGSHFDVSQGVNIPKDLSSFVMVSGGVSCYFAFIANEISPGQGIHHYPIGFYPTSAQLTINQVPVGKKYVSDSSGHFSFDELIDLSQFSGLDILKVGVRYFYDTPVYYQPFSSLPWPSGGYAHYYLFHSEDSDFSIDFRKSDTSSVVDDERRHEETKGLLATIIEWLTSIRDGIVNVGTAIAQLPGKIANLIIDGIKSLFIPSEEDLNGLKDQYEALLSERLGFIWQAGEWITSFGSDLLSALSGGSEAEFVFPGVGFDMNGEHYQLIAEQTVDFDANGIVTVIRPFVGTIVALVVVAACVNLFHDMVGALISGKSYFDFLKGGGG